jgi:hypothetical protein
LKCYTGCPLSKHILIFCRSKFYVLHTLKQVCLSLFYRMNAEEKYAQMKSRLDEIESESEYVITQYLLQVTTDATSLRIRELQKKHQQLRNEQMQLYDALLLAVNKSVGMYDAKRKNAA